MAIELRTASLTVSGVEPAILSKVEVVCAVMVVAPPGATPVTTPVVALIKDAE